MSRGSPGVLAAVCGAAGIVLFGTSTPSAAPPHDRTISMRNIHTDETITVTYKKGGRYDPEAMKKINWIMRDWRRDLATTMDPSLVDLIWEMHAELGSRQPVNIISGYRSPATNDKLRKTSGGQAKNSRHILGMAADIQFPDVPVRKLRYAALIRERGGVGYYPTSGTPFVHVDTGRVRAWPRLPRHELALLFPGAQTEHLPASGGPLTRADVREARAHHNELAVEVAAFHQQRNAKTRPPTFAIASADFAEPTTSTQKPETRRVAALPPAAIPVAAQRPPRLVTAPKLADRPVRLAPRPTDADRRRMTQLAVLAALPASIVPRSEETSAQPAKAARPGKTGSDMTRLTKQAELAMESAETARQRSQPAPEVENPRLAFVSASAATALGYRSGWASAPAWDPDHPEESAYRPFPLAPFLTMSAGGEAAAAHFMRPDFLRMAELFDPSRAQEPLRLRPGRTLAKLIWTEDATSASVPVSRLGSEERRTTTAVALHRVRSQDQPSGRR